jgi:hypothetical protein
MQRFAVIMAAALLLGLGTGCETDWSDPMGHRANFEEIQEKFTKFVRWGAVDEAALFVHEEQREDFLTLAPELTDMRFTDYEIITRVYEEEDTKATVVVRYMGYRLSLPIEKAFRITQEWTKDPETDAWTVRLDVERFRIELATSRS